MAVEKDRQDREEAEKREREKVAARERRKAELAVRGSVLGQIERAVSARLTFVVPVPVSCP